MPNNSVKHSYFLLRTIILILLLCLLLQPITTLAAGSPQTSFDCPATLSTDDCEILQASQTAIQAVSSVHIATYTLTTNLDLDLSNFSLSTGGSGDLLLQNGAIMTAELTLTDVSFTSPDTSLTGDGILRIVENTAYIGLVGDDESISWAGATIDLTSPELAVFSGFSDLIQELNTVSTVVTWSRDEDLLEGDTPIAVFYVDFSARGLLQSSQFVEWLSAGLTEVLADTFDQDFISPTLATAIISELTNQLSQDIGDDYSFRITQHISLDDFLIRRVTIELNVTLGLGMLQGLSAELPESLTLSLNFDATIDQYNNNPVIQAPETYQDISDDLATLFDTLLNNFIEGLGINDDNDDTINTGDSVDLVVGEPITATLEANSDPHTYRFEAKRGDTVQIAVRADETSNLDTYLQLFDTNGDRLADNDDALNPPSDLNLGPLDSYIEYTSQRDSFYIIEVSSVFEGDSGSYTLTLIIN